MAKSMYDKMGKFEWDPTKNWINREKHGISFEEAMQAFIDPKRVIIADPAHSKVEKRYYCFGAVGNKIATVRYTVRRGVIRIIGAGYWRNGKAYYEKTNAH